MKRLILLGTLLLLIVGGCENPVDREVIPLPEESLNTELAAPLEIPSGENGDIIPGEYIVVFKNSVTSPEAKAQEVLGNLGIDFSTSVRSVYKHSIKGFAGSIPDGRLNALRNHPLVAYVEPDRLIKIEPMIAEVNLQDKTVVTGSEQQVVPWGIIRVGGGITVSSDNVIWIIDTGLDLDHPDLNVDTENSTSFAHRIVGRRIREELPPDDGHGHGTHVAGTAAAIDNDKGVVGVAAGATVVAVRVLDDGGSGTYSWIIEGIDYVAGKGSSGDVANMSLGGSFSKSVNDAVIAASVNVKFALSAGNESDSSKHYSPASAEGKNIYTVSAMDRYDDFAYFSNYGNPPVDYAQPGVAVTSLNINDADGISAWNGTSMAAPHLAGLLFLDNGITATHGTVTGDPDDTPDPIAVFSERPAVTFDVTPDDNNPRIITFSNSNANTVTLYWDFGYDADDDGVNETATGVSATHEYPDISASYNVTLVARDRDEVSGELNGAYSYEVTPIDIISSGNQPPIADFTYDATPGILTVSFDASSSSDPDGSVKSYSWDFGDGNTGSGAKVSHTYASASTYTVTLTVTDDKDATGSISDDVTVTDGNTIDNFDASALGYKEKGRKNVKITWVNASNSFVTITGAVGDPVQVDSEVGEYIHNIGTVGGGTYNYLIKDDTEEISLSVTF